MKKRRKPPRGNRLRWIAVGGVPGLLFCLLALPAGVEAQAVEGMMIDAETRTPVRGAVIQVTDTAGAFVGSAVSDSTGTFRVGLQGREGPFRLRAQAFGYVTRDVHSFRVPAGETLTFPEIPMVPDPVILDSLSVEVRRLRRGRTPGQEKVRHRQIAGFGTFIPGSLIADSNPPTLTSFVQELAPGIEIAWYGAQMNVLRSEEARCLSLRVNEFLLGPGNIYADLDDIPYDDIAAVEVYPTFREVPPELQILVHPCGLINVWTWVAW